MTAIILFDGVCNLCNKSVQFILKRDKKGYFRFASIQGEFGQRILREYGVRMDVDSVLLIEKNRCYTKSSAAFRICKHLKAPWSIFYVFLVIPPYVRDLFYELIAKNRYKWFGQRESCMLLLPEWKNRFLD